VFPNGRQNNNKKPSRKRRKGENVIYLLGTGLNNEKDISIEYLSERTGVTLNNLSIVSGHNSSALAETRAVCLELLKMGRRVGYYVKNKEDMMNLLDFLLVRNKKLKIKVHAGFELGTRKGKVRERWYNRAIQGK
jgi:hypothetical protein